MHFYLERKHAVFLIAEVKAHVIRYEYGHTLDYGFLGLSKWEDIGKAMDQDRVRYISKSGALTRRGENILRDLGCKAKPALSDTFTVPTKNRICGRYMHKTEYWKLGLEYQKAEVVANAYDGWASGQKESLNQYCFLFSALVVVFDILFGATYTIQ